MAAGGWVTNTGASAVALVAATAKTAIGIVGVANRGFTLCEFGVSFDGVTASAVPVLVELMTSTAATAGTSTAGTFSQVRGRVNSAGVGATSAINYTVEPTVLTSTRQWLVTPNGGVLVVQFPLGREPEGDGTTTKALMIRLTAPAIVDYRAYAEIESA